MRYYKFSGLLARGNDDVLDYTDLRTRFEFYKNKKWVKDYERSLHLSDAMMDYGDYSVLDYDEISEEEAEELIKRGHFGLDSTK